MSREQDIEDMIDAEKRRFIRSLSERGSAGGSGTDSTGGSFGGSDDPMRGRGKGYDVQPEKKKVQPKKTMIPMPIKGRLFPEQTLKELEKAKVIDDISKDLGLTWKNLDPKWETKIKRGVKKTYTADLRD
jgi:hypothetical protein